ncbi:MAG: porin family protein [Prevotellaceae bacterium]|jgi:outer membrane protein X|nr:porin family protein [Prevotellaceae bacterium]
MKKVIFTAILAIATAVSVNAQWKVGANLGLQVPTGTFGDVSGTGFGLAANGEYLATENIGIGAQLGYYSFGEKESGSGSWSIVPITVTGKYYFMTEGLKPYAGLDLGFYSLSYEVDLGILGANVSTSETKFGLAPVVGLQYDFSDNWALDANLKYNYITTSGDAVTSFGINVGVVYSIK